MKWLLKGTPRKAQVEGCTRALERIKGYGLFMEMGLGKTATDLNIYANLLHSNIVDVQVVVCPPSLRSNWRDEADMWGISVPVHVWPDVPPVLQLKVPCLVIMNYEAFSAGRARGVEWVDQCCKRYQTRVSLDESIQIKNPQATRTKNLILCTKEAVSTCDLSGCPTSQGPHDLWAQGRFARALEGRFHPWRNYFCQMGGYMGKKILGVKREREQELRDWLSTWSFRATKAEYTDLPDKIYAPPREVGLSPEQLKHYREMEYEFITFVKGMDGERAIEAEMAITKMNKLQQISSGFVIDADHNVHRLCARIPKLEEVKEIIEQVGSKVIVVAFYKESLRILEEGLVEFKPIVLRGGMTDDEVSRVKKQFNEDSECRVAILQTSSHKYGHTLLGQAGNDRCHTTIFYENSFSLDDRLQMEDRNHRYGQDKAVLYVDLACSPVEKEAVKALQRKQSVVDAIIDYVRK